MTTFIETLLRALALGSVYVIMALGFASPSATTSKTKSARYSGGRISL